MSLPPLIRVLVVDDHRVVRLGIKTLLQDVTDIVLVGEAINSKSAISEAAKLRPDLVLLDIRLPDADGFKTCRAIKESNPSIKVLMLTSVADDQVVLQAMAAGADGYLLKAIEDVDIPESIRTVMSGGAMLDPLIARKVINQIRPAQPSPTHHLLSPERHHLLSPQETRVLELVATGKTNKEIAMEMGLGEKTVRNYLSNVFSKLHITRRSEAAAYYTRISVQQSGSQPRAWD